MKPVNNTQAKPIQEQQNQLSEDVTKRPMADVASCPESLKLVKKINRPGLFRVMELIGKASD